MGVRVMKDDGWDFAKRPAGELAPKPTAAESQKHVLEVFDKNVAAAGFCEFVLLVQEHDLVAGRCSCQTAALTIEKAAPGRLVPKERVPAVHPARRDRVPQDRRRIRKRLCFGVESAVRIKQETNACASVSAPDRSLKRRPGTSGIENKTQRRRRGGHAREMPSHRCLARTHGSDEEDVAQAEHVPILYGLAL